MKNRKVQIRFGMLITMVALMLGLTTAIALADEGTKWQPAPAKAGMASIVWTNFNGGSQEVLIDLNGTIYKVQQQANDIPGRLQIDIAPGRYAYTAHVPGLGAVGSTIELTSGQVMGENFYSTFTVERNHDKRNGSRNELVPQLAVAHEDLTGQLSGQAATLAVVEPATPARTGMASIVWSNFNGGSQEVLIDLNGAIYKVQPQANNIPGRLQIDVAPGRYVYTAHVPGLGSVSRTIELTSGQVMGENFYSTFTVERNHDKRNGSRDELVSHLAVAYEDLTGELSGNGVTDFAF